MEELLFELIDIGVLLIYAIAATVLILSTLAAAFGAAKASFQGNGLREVGLNYGRWLIAGLTFMLAADILATMIETDLEGIARLAAIAGIRTFLNYFLERDLREMRDSSPADNAKEN